MDSGAVFCTCTARARDAEREMCGIWRDCFPSDGERDAMLFCRHSGAEALLLRAGGRTAGGCGIVPLTAGELRGGYIFALGVLSAYRGRGGMRLLLAAAREHGAEHGLDFLALVPADDGLARTYSRCGFVGQIEIPHWEVAAGMPLHPTHLPPPNVSGGRVIMPGAGFVDYIRATYGEFDLGGAGLVCGDEQNGRREVFEYIPGDGDEGITPVALPDAGMLLPLTPAAERLRRGYRFYCSMGE